MDESSMVIEDRARIAVYDNLLSAPRIVDIPPQEIPAFIEDIAVTVYELSRQQGGQLPYTVIREITENFIHAGFLECTVSILDEGNTLRFADQGPGITKKELVLQPGVSSASRWMKDYIRGVGSGFPIVREYLSVSQGSLSIEDNAEEGVVVTLSLVRSIQDPGLGDRALETTPAFRAPETKLDAREERALLLLNEHGFLGPVDLAKMLAISAPTATRLLKKLEQQELVEYTQSKKRILSNAGLAYIQGLLVQG